jgi:hypothetical protein
MISLKHPGGLRISRNCAGRKRLCVKSEDSHLHAATTLVLGQLARPGAQVQFPVSGLTNQDYTIQFSTDLRSTSWSTLLTTNSPTPSFLITDPDATNAARLNRILVGP